MLKQEGEVPVRRCEETAAVWININCYVGTDIRIDPPTLFPTSQI